MKRLILSLSLLCGGAGQSFAQAAAPQAGDAFSSFIPLIVIFGIFYFLVIRPQQKQAKQHREMIASLKAGTRVITSGGIHGRITKAEEKDNFVTLEIAENVRVKLLRANIAANLDSTPEPRKNNKGDKDAKDGKEKK